MSYAKGLLLRNLLLFLYTVLLPLSHCFANTGNENIISYFTDNSYYTDNIIAELVFSNVYYSIAIALILAILAGIFKKFREILFSVLLAIFGVLLVMFLYESFENFSWLPST